MKNIAKYLSWNVNKSMRHVLLGVLLGGLSISGSLQADDTDIYLRPPINPGMPQLMLVLEYKSNGGSSSLPFGCSSVVANAGPGNSCYDGLGRDLFVNFERVLCGYPNSTCTVSDTGGVTGTINITPNANDILRAELVTVLADPTVSGLKVGFMMPHRNKGAMIMKGFTPLLAGDDAFNGTFGPRMQLIQRMLNVPYLNKGTDSHAFKPQSIFFELFRYLKGGAIFMGHESAGDWGGSSGTQTNNTAYLDGSGNRTYINGAAAPYMATTISETLAGNPGTIFDSAAGFGAIGATCSACNIPITISGFTTAGYSLSSNKITAAAGGLHYSGGSGGFSSTANLAIGDVVTVSGFPSVTTTVITGYQDSKNSGPYATLALCQAAPNPKGKSCVAVTVTTTASPNTGDYTVITVSDTDITLAPVGTAPPITADPNTALNVISVANTVVPAPSPNNGNFTITNMSANTLTVEPRAPNTLPLALAPAGSAISITRTDVTASPCGDVKADRCNTWDATTPADVLAFPAAKLTAVEKGDGTYVSPYSASGSCANTTVLSSWNQESSNDGAKAATAAGVMAEMTGISGSSTNDIISWMHKNDVTTGTPGTQTVTFYTMTDGSGAGEGGADSAAQAGGGKHIIVGSNAQADLAAIKAIFQSVLATSATYVSPTIPVNAYNRAESGLSAYLSLFEAGSSPLWAGNIKKLNISSAGVIVDANGNPAYCVGNDAAGTTRVDAYGNTVYVCGPDGVDQGRLRTDIITPWTSGENTTGTTTIDSSTGTVITSASGDLPIYPQPPLTDAFSESQSTVSGSTTTINTKVYGDGRGVSLGGAGQIIPGNTNQQKVAINPIASLGNGALAGGNNAGFGSSRMLFTNSGTTVQDFNVSNFASFNLGVVPADYGAGAFDAVKHAQFKKEVIGFLRGNAVQVNGTADAATVDRWGTPRSWLLGDIMHSRPLAINYGGSSSAQDVRIFAGSNDGLFHQFRDLGALKTGGGEVWAFLPEEMQPMIKQLPLVKAKPMHPYGVDGEAASLLIDNNGDSSITGADKAYVVFGMRRGGTSYYALDVTNPDAAPTVLWKVTPSTPGFSQLAMTFAKPLTGFVNVNGTQTAVAIFPGGYYGGYAADNVTRIGKDAYAANNQDAAAPTADTSGKVVAYVVNIQTGALISTLQDAGQSDGVSASLTPHYVLASNGIRVIDRLYVGDTGGRVWRANMENPSPTSWTVSKLADLGYHSGGADLRFLEAAAVVDVLDIHGNPYTAVAITSGDREHPLGTNVTDKMFMLRDRSAFPSQGQVQPLTLATLTDVTNATADTDGSAISARASDGWFFDYTRSGEKGVSRPVVLFGTIFFSTYEPNFNISNCEMKEGSSFLYQVALKNGVASNPFGLTVSAGDRSIETGAGMASDLTLFTIPGIVGGGGGGGGGGGNTAGGSQLCAISQGLTFCGQLNQATELYTREIGVDYVH